MGWKGTVRSVGAAIRRAERNAQRQHRELERQRRHYEKMAAVEQARLEVAEYENYVERLVTLHQEGSTRFDWRALAARPEPSRPKRRNETEAAARAALEGYRPSLAERLLRRQERRRQELEQALNEAPAEDERLYREALRNYETALEEWRDSRLFVERVLRLEAEAIIEAVRELNPFAEITQIGSALEFRMDDGAPLSASLHVHGEKVVPTFTKSLLRSGRVSFRDLPKTRYYSLYQDHVCSAVLRVARELFSIAPIESVVVTAQDKLLDPQTGHLAEQAILSALIPRATFESLDLERIDPSDSMRNFIHRMELKKSSGFSSVVPIDPQESVRR